jgi:uncharacterized protein YcsI (UPF0317 family)
VDPEQQWSYPALEAGALALAARVAAQVLGFVKVVSNFPCGHLDTVHWPAPALEVPTPVAAPLFQVAMAVAGVAVYVVAATAVTVAVSVAVSIGRVIKTTAGVSIPWDMESSDSPSNL